MYKPTVNQVGIEGDDIPFHLKLLGADADRLTQRLWFFPLVDHYNTHGSDWVAQQTTRAGLADAVVFYDLVHTGDRENQQHKEFVKNFPHPRKYWLTVNQYIVEQDDYVQLPWDFMWNRFKAYYTESIPENLYLHHYSFGKYTLPKLDINQRKTKKFLSLCGREFGYRTDVYTLVNEYNTQGYISNRSRGQYLERETTIGAFNPVPTMFYTDSCLSVYVESNFINNDLIHITEKSFDPLVKGHFILPFSNPGVIDRLSELGFAFPDFIDYSYDKEPNVERRFKMFSDEFRRLMTVDLQEMYQGYFKVLKYNQECVSLSRIDYDDRILKLYDL